MDAEVEAHDLEVAPLARVHRSRIAFALAVTLAAIPVLVVDNMSATAEPTDTRVEVAAPAAERTAITPSTTVATVPSTTTTAPPTTSTAAATTSTEASTTTAVAVQTLRAPAPTAPPTTVAPPPPTTTTTAAPSGDTAVWDQLAACESGGNWSLNNGNGYYGGLQFSLATWQDVGGTGYPHLASKAEQIKRGQILQARYGWGQWPYCAGQLGLL